MKKNILSIIFISGLAVSCMQNSEQVLPRPIAGDSNMCPTADKHLSMLCEQDPIKNKYCCEVDSPTKKGKSFTQFCVEKQHQGVSLNPGCLSQIVSCQQIDICTNSK